MRIPLWLSCITTIIIAAPCYSQQEVENYLQFREIAEKYSDYTISIDDSAMSPRFTQKELRKVFGETFSFLNRKKRIDNEKKTVLNIHVVFEDLHIYLPAAQLIYDPSYPNALKKYNVITKYSMSIKLRLDDSDSSHFVYLCKDRYFTKEKKLSIANPNSPAAQNGAVFSNVADALSMQRKDYEPGRVDIKESFLALLDHYRRRVNAQ